MTGETLVEMPQILYRVKIHQKAYFKVSEKKEILEHPWVNYGFAKIFLKKYWNCWSILSPYV